VIVLDPSPHSRGWRGLLTSGSPATRADVVWNLVTLAVMLGAVWMHSGDLHHPGTARLLFTLASWLPLTVRTRWPEPVLALVVLIEVAQLIALPDLGTAAVGGSVVGAYQPVPVATMLAIYTVASRWRPRAAWAFGAGSALVLSSAALLGQDRTLIGTVVVMAELVLVATGVGVAVRMRRELRLRRARDAEEQARHAVLDERLRIARELHDTLAHNLALIDAQAGVADFLLETNPAAAREALRGITTHTGSAIDDLRATLQLLRSDDPGRDAETDPTSRSDSFEPVVGLAQLERLVERVGLTGTSIEVDISGSPGTVRHQTDLAAYRVIQEALTNATKHAPGAPLRITLEWTAEHLVVTVLNPAPGEAPSRGSGTGHGLLGLAERVRVAGGTFTAGPTPDGGFQVRAVLPTTPGAVGARPSTPTKESL
jgi:signal transduction histidine kinase